MAITASQYGERERWLLADGEESLRARADLRSTPPRRPVAPLQVHIRTTSSSLRGSWGGGGVINQTDEGPPSLPRSAAAAAVQLDGRPPEADTVPVLQSAMTARGPQIKSTLSAQSCRTTDLTDAGAPGRSQMEFSVRQR